MSETLGGVFSNSVPIAYDPSTDNMNESKATSQNGDNNPVTLYKSHDGSLRLGADDANHRRLSNQFDQFELQVDQTVSSNKSRSASLSGASDSIAPAAQHAGSVNQQELMSADAGPDIDLNVESRVDTVHSGAVIGGSSMTGAPQMPTATVAPSAPPAADGDVEPALLSKNPTMKLIWAAVDKKLNAPNLDADHSKEGGNLRRRLNQYHDGLDVLKAGMADIDPDAKPGKSNKAQDQEAEKELAELRDHLGAMKQLNAELSALKRDKFPGNDHEYVAWQNDLRGHNDAFDALIDILDSILKGERFGGAHDPNNKKKS